MNAFFNWLHTEEEVALAVRVGYAAFLGAVVGIEREYRHKDVGVRTMSVIAMGACLFTIISSQVPNSDPLRMASNIVVGVGFLGGGIIYHQQNHTIGLTTAASLWAVAAIGTCVGIKMYLLSAACTVLTFLILSSHHLFPEGADKPGDQGSKEI